ncbi:hypothetical protein ACQY0O_000612 [Thecaphora frezii]
MAARSRILPLLGASAVGVGIGYYVFDPLLRQYAHDTNGTFIPPPPGGAPLPDLKDGQRPIALQNGADIDERHPQTLHDRPPPGSAPARGVSGIVARGGTDLKAQERGAPIPGSAPYGTVSQDLENLKSSISDKVHAAEDKADQIKRDAEGRFERVRDGAEQKAGYLADQTRQTYDSTKQSADAAYDKASYEAERAKSSWFGFKKSAEDTAAVGQQKLYNAEQEAEAKLANLRNSAKDQYGNLRDGARDTAASAKQSADAAYDRASQEVSKAKQSAESSWFSWKKSAEDTAAAGQQKLYNAEQEAEAKLANLRDEAHDVAASARSEAERQYEQARQAAHDGYTNLRDKADSSWHNLKDEASAETEEAKRRLHNAKFSLEGKEMNPQPRGGIWNWIFGNKGATENVAANLE